MNDQTSYGHGTGFGAGFGRRIISYDASLPFTVRIAASP